ncbi:unnamed protein product [marine sediment metagenome]|uniref:Uncharacterized protein n=1 Tax=marine sediment metagenome TaxID=412755 RepID=X1UZX7_9ZZZZ
MKKEEHEGHRDLRRMDFARQEAAQAWCKEKTRDKAMDTELAEEFAKILVKHMYAPKLGCATTREILEELKTRIEMDGKLDYKTIDQD